MRGVTTLNTNYIPYINISTHTPHARRDSAVFHIVQTAVISTHTPHARRDVLWGISGELYLAEFQLTRLMRGVTVFVFQIIKHYFISTHTPHARRDFRQS